MLQINKLIAQCIKNPKHRKTILNGLPQADRDFILQQVALATKSGVKTPSQGSLLDSKDY